MAGTYNEKSVIEPVAIKDRPGRCANASHSHPNLESRVRSSRATLRDAMRGTLSLADQVVVSAANFLMLVISSHYCSTFQMGIFMLALSIANFARTIQERAVAAPYVVFVHHRNTHARTYLGSSLVQQLAVGLVTSLATTLVALVYFLRGSGEFSGILLALAIVLPTLLLRDHIRSICFAHFQLKSALAMDLTVTVLQVGGVWLLAVSGWFGITAVIFVLGLACLSPSLLWLNANRAKIEVARHRLIQDTLRNWRYSQWLIAARVIAMGGLLFMPWIVAFQLGEVATGVFGVCNSLIGVSLMIVMGVNNFFQPNTLQEFRRGGVAGMVRSIVEFVVLVGTMLVAISVILWFSGGPLLGLIYGPQYANHGMLVFLLSLSTIAMSFSIAIGNGLSVFEKPQLFIPSEFAFFAFSISTALLLIPRLGLFGACIALILGGVASSIVGGIMLLSQIKKHLRIQQRSSETYEGLL